jgi:hypothetical protein
MGVDWAVMFPNKDANRAELMRLIRQQADAFQAMPSYWDRDIMTPRSVLDRTKEEHEPLYLTSSRALHGLLEFPEYDETGRLPEYPGLAPCWRVYPITESPIFPPQWRLRAFRTFLPDELGAQIEEWRRWLAAVDRGEYRDYLFELYAHEMTKSLFVGWRDLKEHIDAVASETGERAPGESLAALCRSILRHPVPEITPAPIRPYPAMSGGPTGQRRNSQEGVILAQAKEWVANIREWGAAIDDETWRSGFSEADFPAFDEYLALTHDSWLLDFLAWAETCHSFGMGLALDY